MRWLNAWLPVVAVCVVIFLFSADANSMKHSNAVLGWLFFRFGAPGLWLQNLLAEPFRKFAHVCVYALLGALTFRAWAGPELQWRSLGPKATRAAVKAWIFCAVYASSDEFHQSFVPTRGPSVRDVMLDSVSALAAILLLMWLTRPAGEELAVAASEVRA